MRNFIDQQWKTLRSDLGVNKLEIMDVLDDNNALRLIESNNVLGYFEKPKRLAKVYALALLQKLINSEDKEPVAVTAPNGDRKILKTVGDLEQFLSKFYGDDVFSSSLSKVGRMQKLFIVADHYIEKIRDGADFVGYIPKQLSAPF